jgi:uncharacterized membrane protein HdeD (DUF308 family)
MEYLLVRSAAALAWRGAFMIALGLSAVLLPGSTYLALVIVFGAFAFIDGLTALIQVFDDEAKIARGWLLLEAIAGIVVGIVTFIWPNVAALNLIFVIAVWAIAMGAFRIAEAVGLRKLIHHEWLLALSGVASIIFGAILMAMPLPGIVGLMWALGVFALILGGMQIALAIRLRRWAGQPVGTEMRRAA